MKTIKFCLLIASMFTLASCSIQLYPTKTMSENYTMRMDSSEELNIKSKVKIFLNESDVNGKYEVMSYMTYSPAISIPLIYGHHKQMLQKFYEKAAKKAYELGGNGVIIVGGGYCKIINLVEWIADDEAPATFVNIIFNRELMDKFQSGSVAALAKNSARKREENAFEAEIKSNIEYARQLDEVAFIREKMTAFESYNKSLAKPKASITKALEDLNKDLNKVEKKIKARLKKEAKKAAKAQTQK